MQALTDGLNYGFYLPPSHGKAGKFLEEERLFSDYPTDPANMPFLEVKFHSLFFEKISIGVFIKFFERNCFIVFMQLYIESTLMCFARARLKL